MKRATVAAFFLSVLVGGFLFFYAAAKTYESFNEVQKEDFVSFVRLHFPVIPVLNNSFAEIYVGPCENHMLAVDSSTGHLTRCLFKPTGKSHADLYNEYVLQNAVYGGKGLIEIFKTPIIVSCALSGLLFLLIVLNARPKDKHLRGPKIVSKLWWNFSRLFKKKAVYILTK